MNSNTCLKSHVWKFNSRSILVISITFDESFAGFVYLFFIGKKNCWFEISAFQAFFRGRKSFQFPRIYYLLKLDLLEKGNKKFCVHSQLCLSWWTMNFVLNVMLLNYTSNAVWSYLMRKNRNKLFNGTCFTDILGSYFYRVQNVWIFFLRFFLIVWRIKHQDLNKF